MQDEAIAITTLNIFEAKSKDSLQIIEVILLTLRRNIRKFIYEIHSLFLWSVKFTSANKLYVSQIYLQAFLSQCRKKYSDGDYTGDKIYEFCM